MAKKRSKKIVEPDIIDEDEDEAIEGDEVVVDDDDDDDGLTYTKRFTVSYFQPEKSSGGSRCYKDFYETNTMADAKKEAQKAIEEKNVTMMISDRENWYLGSILMHPEVNEVKEDEDDTTIGTTKKSSGVRNVGRKGAKRGTVIPDSTKSDSTLPKPKHPRKKRS